MLCPFTGAAWKLRSYSALFFSVPTISSAKSKLPSQQLHKNFILKIKGRILMMWLFYFWWSAFVILFNIVAASPASGDRTLVTKEFY
jgi:hypothetical protein